jgi:hypothetical protein
MFILTLMKLTRLFIVFLSEKEIKFTTCTFPSSKSIFNHTLSGHKNATSDWSWLIGKYIQTLASDSFLPQIPTKKEKRLIKKFSNEKKNSNDS